MTVTQRTIKPPPSLVRHLAGGRCVLFVGAGLSAWGNLPKWGELLDVLVKKLGEADQRTTQLRELKRLLKAEKFLEVADYCKENLGRGPCHEVLENQLHSDNNNVPEPHKIIVQLPFAAVVTTNYDKLLEHAFSKFGNGLPAHPTHQDKGTLASLLSSGNFYILKAHGDIDDPNSLVLTTSDYRDLIHSNLAFNAFFSTILLTKSILFLGYSMNDPDFRLLLDRQLTIFEDIVPERYALMKRVGQVERDVLWRTAKIKVLSYKEHDEVLPFLKALQDDYQDFLVNRAGIST